MKRKSALEMLAEAIKYNKKLAFIIVSFVTILVIFVNLSYTHSALVGSVALSIYFFINSTFWGDVFSKGRTRC